MKLLSAVALVAAFVGSHSSFAASLECSKLADEKRLTGAPRASYLKKCEADAGGGALGACQKAADEKKLAGAARNAHMKKCLKDNPGKG